METGRASFLLWDMAIEFVSLRFSPLTFSRTLKEFYWFYYSYFLPHPAGDRCEWESGWVLSCWLWSTHHRCSSAAARAAKSLWEGSQCLMIRQGWAQSYCKCNITTWVRWVICTCSINIKLYILSCRDLLLSNTCWLSQSVDWAWWSHIAARKG